VQESELFEIVEARGLSRREFLKYCAHLAALIGLTELHVPEIVEAITRASSLKPAVWISQGLCTGCTESVAQSYWPTPAEIVLDLLSINYWETLMWGAGKNAEGARKDTIVKDKGKYLVIVEGSIEEAEGGNVLRIAGKTGLEVLEETARDAEAVIAVGSCAVDGGWVAARPNTAKAIGTMDYLKKVGIDTPVINLPTCPVNPEWVTGLLIDFLVVGRLPELDEKNRPKIWFGQTIHDQCERRAHFERGEFVEKFGSPEEMKNWCLYKMGCKGPTTLTNCPVVRWNRKASWCIEAGSPCIGCGTVFPNWVDSNAPFFERLAETSLPGVLGVTPPTIGTALGIATAVGIGAHLVGQAVTGRVGKGGPREESKEGGGG
jgi:hydrogenase small subunit